MISLIVARDRHGAIGKENRIPWHIPEDLAFFKETTRNAAIIMGRSTWESLPVRPLRDRLNIVVSSNAALADHVVASPEEAVVLVGALGYVEIFGIGGAGIYRDMLPFADRLYITEVATVIEGADTYFPDVDWANWRVAESKVLRAEGPSCYVRILDRIAGE